MTLIKHAQAAMLARDAIVLDLGDLRRQGESIVAQAQARAQAIAREAERERDRIVAGAAERGHAEGVARGEAEGRVRGEAAGRADALAAHRAVLEGLASRWAEAVRTFEADRAGLIDSSQRDVIRLAVLIAERITKRIVQTDPGVAAAQVSAALQLVLRPTGVVVGVHPEDRSNVEAALPAMVAAVSAASHVSLVDDPSISRGSCVVRCVGSSEHGNAGSASVGGGGEIDASIETQLNRIAELIVPARAEPDSAAGDDA